MITSIPVKIMLSFSNYALIKNAAESRGVSINQYAHDRVMSNEGSQC